MNCADEHGMTPLLSFCRYYDEEDLVELVEFLILKGSDLKHRNKIGYNALAIACRYYKSNRLPHLIQLMIRHGIDVDCKTDEHGMNSLLLLCLFNHGKHLKESIRLLLESGIDVNSTTTEGLNALMFLCRFHPDHDGLLIDYARLFIEHGINVNQRNAGGCNVLHVLCRYYKGSRLSDLINLLAENSIDLQCQTTKHGMNALLMLCLFQTRSNCFFAALRTVVRLGVDVNVETKDGWTAFSFLCHYYSDDDLYDIIEFLGDRGATLNVGHAGHNPFITLGRYYANANLLNIFRLLLRKGVDPKVNTVDGKWNALLVLAQHYSGQNLLEIISLLVEHGVDINYRNDEGWSALLLLCQNYIDQSLIDIVRRLIHYGVDVNAKTNSGCNALLLLCRHHCSKDLYDILQLLIHNGIDVHCADENGWNAILTLCHYYREDNLIDLLRLLTAHGVDVRRQTNEGWNALLILCRHYAKRRLRALLQFLLACKLNVGQVTADGTNAFYLLAGNWSGQLHAIFDGLPNSDLDLVVNSEAAEQLTMKAAEMGCSYMVYRLLSRMTVNIVNATGRDAFDYLNDLIDERAYVICSSCSAEDIRDSNFVRYREQCRARPRKAIKQVDFERRIIEQKRIKIDDTGIYYTYYKMLRRMTVKTLDSLSKGSGDVIDSLYKFYNSCYIRHANECDCYEHSQYQQRQGAQPVGSSYANWLKPGDESVFQLDLMNGLVSPPSKENWTAIVRAWHSDAPPPWQQIEAYVDRYSHCSELCHYADCSWCRVGDQVYTYVKCLMAKVGEFDPLFETEDIFLYGSAGERTSLFQPDEFDFGIVLRRFSHRPCVSDPSRVACTGDTSSYGEPINSDCLLVHFMGLISRAINAVYSVHAFSPVVSLQETCVTIHFLYRGPYSPTRSPMVVGIDLSIVLPTEHSVQPIWLQEFPKWFADSMPKSRVEYLVALRRAKCFTYWRPSYPTLARDILIKAGQPAQQVHKLLKFLVLIEHAKHDDNEEMSRKTSVSSYALKTCLFRYLHLEPPPWRSEDIVRHAIGVLRQFPMNSSRLWSYFIEDIAIFNITQRSKTTVQRIMTKLSQI